MTYPLNDDNWNRRRHLYLDGIRQELRAGPAIGKVLPATKVFTVPNRDLIPEDLKALGNVDGASCDVWTGQPDFLIEFKASTIMAESSYDQIRALLSLSLRWACPIAPVLIVPDMSDSRDVLGPRAKIAKVTTESVSRWQFTWAGLNDRKLRKYARTGRLF